MASAVKPLTITSPGFYGLNTEDSAVMVEPQFARRLENTIIDEDGQLGSRKGWTYIAESSGVNLKGMHRFLDVAGTEYFGAWSDTGFYIKSGSNLSSVTYSGSNTLADGNWQAATLNDAAYLFQRGYNPIYFNPTTGVLDDVVNATNTATVTITHSGVHATVTHASHQLTSGDTVIISGADQANYNGTFTVTVTGTNTYEYTMSSNPHADATGTITASWFKGTPPQANTVLSAYGRIWVADTPTNKTTVYWSNLLDGAEWREGIGTVGSLDISGILVYGNDEIVGLGAHNGRLIIFCKNNIIIMDDQSAGKQYLDPADMNLVEVITGIGCISRDSIQNIGQDILFLSESGVRSLGRTIQEKSQPMSDLTNNVRTQLMRDVRTENYENVKSAYSDYYGVYLLALPSQGLVYTLDTKRRLPDNTLRVSLWNNLDHTFWLSYDSTMYMSNVDGITEYTGYTDNGSPYTVSYYTKYFDFGLPNNIKIAKELSAVALGGTGETLKIRLASDYSNNYTDFPVSMNQLEVAEYNVAEFGVDAYTSGTAVEDIRTAVGRSGKTLQLGFETDVSGAPFNLQQVSLYVKQGRIF
jgi:hypothetical protein